MGRAIAAIGKRIRPYAKGVWREVVGVVSDTRDHGVTKKAPSVAYWPIAMAAFSPGAEDPVFALRHAAYLVRSERTGADGFVRELEQAIWAVNPNLPLASVRTLEEIYDASLARTSFTLVMLAIAGGMALLLGVAGIYGVISYAVVAAAAGDRHPHRARGAVAGDHAACSSGTAWCSPASAWRSAWPRRSAVTRLMTSLLFEVSPVDPLTYAVVSLTLFAAAVLACYLPALRATRVDPIGALRAE